MKKADWSEVLKKGNTDILYSRKDARKVLELVGNRVSNSNILDDQGEELILDESTVKPRDLGAIMSGSKIFLRNNIASFQEFLKTR